MTNIALGAGSVTYSTFDADATEVLRLNFAPETVTEGGRPIARRADLNQPGYTFDDATRVLYVHHSSSRDIDIEGKSEVVPPSIVTFDDPHLSAGSPLTGHYPNNYFDWGTGLWKAVLPSGKFGKFHITFANSVVTRAEVQLAGPRVFDGIDVYNSSDSNVTLTVAAPNSATVSLTQGAGELRRFRTGCRVPAARVTFETSNPSAIQFDNLAFHLE